MYNIANSGRSTIPAALEYPTVAYNLIVGPGMRDEANT